jgi:phosphoribosylanthranilate isomerase
LRGEFPKLVIIKAIGVSSAESFSVCSEYVDEVDYFLFDTEIKSGDSKISGGTGQMFSWDLLSEYTLDHPYFLSGGLSPDNMTLINQLCDKDSHLAGVDLNSRYELSPGLKDVVLLQESFNILRG